MKWSAAKEILKTFAILALEVIGFFAILTLVVAGGITVVVSIIAVLWFWFVKLLS